MSWVQEPGEAVYGVVRIRPQVYGTFQGRKNLTQTNKKSFTCGHLFRNTVRTQRVSPTWAPNLGREHVLVKVGEGYDVNEKHLCVCSPRCCQLCLGC